MTLLPQDNFVEVPVALFNAIASEVTVSLRAGDVVLDEQRVGLRASFLDRIAIILGVALLGGALLVFIIRRVRSVEDAQEA
jgi:hypothetical protein